LPLRQGQIQGLPVSPSGWLSGLESDFAAEREETWQVARRAGGALARDEEKKGGERGGRREKGELGVRAQRAFRKK
jgi:hypothetical protein